MLLWAEEGFPEVRHSGGDTKVPGCKQTHVGTIMAANIEHILAGQVMGFQLKSKQQEILSKLLQQENVLAILPTGYGKSACYGLFIQLSKQVCIKNTKTEQEMPP